MNPLHVSIHEGHSHLHLRLILPAHQPILLYPPYVLSQGAELHQQQRSVHLIHSAGPGCGKSQPPTRLFFENFSCCETFVLHSLEHDVLIRPERPSLLSHLEALASCLCVEVLFTYRGKTFDLP